MNFFISNLRLLARRFPSVVVINVVGLSAAFAVTLVVAKQVWYDLTFDRGFGNADEIHLVELDWGTGGGPMESINQQIPAIWAERIPQIKDYCLIGTQTAGTYFRKVEDSPGVSRADDVTLLRASPGFMDVFTPEIVAGDASKALLVQGHCMIPASMAARMFGNDDPVGNIIVSGGGEQLLVDAVYRDFPKNSSIACAVYTCQEEQSSMQYNSRGYFVFPSGDLDRVMKQINDPVLLAEVEGGRFTNFKFWLTGLSDFHLRGNAAGEGGYGRTVLYLFVIGLFVLVVAVINFINLSMAMAPSRVRSINIHRILGIGKAGLCNSMAIESVALSAAAVVVGCLIVHRFAGSTLFTDFFTAPLALDAGIPLTAVAVAFFLVMAFAVGLHSARYATSFDVAIALKGSFALLRHGTRLRNTLIVVQFATAIFFICFSAAVAMQYNYMSNYSVGYEKENIVTFDAGRAEVQADALTEELRRNPDIVDVTSSFDMPGAIGSFSGTSIKDKPVSYHTWTIAGNFLDFFGINATPGRVDAGFRLFTSEGEFASTTIVNRELLRKYDFTEDEMAETGIGVTDNVNFESLHEPVKPMAFTILPEWTKLYPKVFVKITGSNVPATIEYIEKTWKAVSGSSNGLNITFLDDELDRLYRRELNTSRLIGILGIVAVVIAIMGVYGLAAFNTRYKTREIAIRKVNGATIGSVMMMLNRGILTLAGVAFVLVVPVTVWMVGKWTGAFAFRISVPWWLYPAAGAIVLLIAVATVSLQSLKAASANPVISLKSE